MQRSHSFPTRLLSIVAAAALALSGCATPPAKETPPADKATYAARVLALDCARVGPDEVRVLAGGPAPRVFLLHGGVFPVHLIMWSFAQFLSRMGYPDASIRDPATGDWSYTPYDTTQHIAGLIAWSYEQEGMRPMIVGHSQGGLFAVKILKELDGQLLAHRPTVYNPDLRAFEDRTTITDPYTGRERPIIGLSVSYASVVGAGGFALALPAWWESFDTLRQIPDTVDEFTGFFVEGDLIALSFRGNPFDAPYEATGRAKVRNVYLPTNYNHITVPDTEALASDPAARAWIDAYKPGDTDTAGLSREAQDHVLWAADVWYSVKKQWCMEAQHLGSARRR
ncbi:MAG: hypothetical protein ABJB78_04485 [Betaproteobacteria bacterium]